MPAACMYCGCTDDRACIITVSAEARAGAEAMGVFDLPDELPCWWISDEPPICSAPTCQRLAAVDDVLTLVGYRAGASP